mmetsp:Transcript_8722/g.14819  ORF Transcript_8722/g.14819 Transcript_8722/m.14819 type:complete len:362 (+) Transcript_8722:69-1154(+)
MFSSSVEKLLSICLLVVTLTRASLFSPQKNKATTEAPVHVVSSLHGTHTHISDLHEAQYVHTPGPHGESIEWVWQRPVLGGRGQTLRGLVFLAHGCSHHSIDFFSRSSSCPKCIGLPEEVRMSGAFLRQQYAVVAISSREHCWSEEDISRIKKVLHIVREELGGGEVPLYAVGASSGGSIVAHLPNLIPNIKAVVVQIMSVQGKSLLHSGGSEGATSYPPSLWIVMTKDDHTLRGVQRTVRYLHQHNKIAELSEANEIPLEEAYFSDRVVGITPQMSKDIVTTLSGCNLLDESSYLLQDPRVSAWRECLKSSKQLWEQIAAMDSLDADLSPISEEMNVAYAMHELTGNHMSEILNFIMKYK